MRRPVPHPRRTHPITPRRRWILAAAAGTLYGATIAVSLTALHARRSRPATTPASIGAALPVAARRPRHASAWLVARAADCTGNLEFLELFDRPPIRERMDLAGAIALGDERAASALHHTLAALGHDLPVRPASPTLRAALASLGHHDTPYLIVLDADGLLRFAIAAPGSIRQYLALGAALPLVGDPDSARHEP